MTATIETCQSGIWQTNSTVISGDGSCLVVDPAYFPGEIDAVAALAASRGPTVAVVFTHGHWDHVMGWQHFPGAEVWSSPSLARAVAAADATSARNLAAAADFDARWYVERPHPHAWPAAVRGLAEGERVLVAGASVEVALLPGHSEDGVALVVDGRTLLPGDYLSPCEIPFVADAAAYRATLLRLVAILGDVAEVIPGHGPRMPSATALEIARGDLVYIDALLAAVARADADAALAIALPRAADVPGMPGHHRSNCRSAGLAVRE